jgi:hypothetical protein
MTAVLAAIAGFNATPPAAVVQLSDKSIFKHAFGDATAAYNLNSGGSVTNQDGTILENWLLSGSASSFEAMATVISGSLDGSDATGSWLSCASSRNWYVTNGGVDNSTINAQIFVQIRSASTHTVLASATITLSAESDNLN